MMKKHLSVVLIIIGAFIMLASLSAPNEVRVEYVDDGDTFKTESGEWVRMARIDAPEVYEAGYERSTSMLKSFILNEKVQLTCDGRGKYDRKICEVYRDDANINDLMLTLGLVERYE